MKKLLCLLVLAACGGGGGGNSDDGAMPDTPVGSTVTVSGTASKRGLGGATPEAGVTIAAYAVTDENAALATTMTDASGNFTLMIPTTGSPIQGFLKATKSGFVTSYLYPPSPISGDLMMVPMNMIATGDFGTLYAFAQTSQMAGKGTIGMLVVSAAELTSPPVAGATVSTSPASPTYKYNGTNGFPSGSATVTAADGLAYAFNAPVGAITINASKSGSTFKPTMLTVHADSLTQTLITP